IVAADRDAGLAKAAADELGDWIWENRERWYSPCLSVREALTQGEKIGRYPIILADHADNTGGGAPGDATEVLRTFLDLGLRDALLLYLVDADSAGDAHRAGIGKKIPVKLGGKSAPIQGSPVEASAEVVALSDGAFA